MEFPTEAMAKMFVIIAMVIFLIWLAVSGEVKKTPAENFARRLEERIAQNQIAQDKIWPKEESLQEWADTMGITLLRRSDRLSCFKVIQDQYRAMYPDASPEEVENVAKKATSHSVYLPAGYDTHDGHVKLFKEHNERVKFKRGVDVTQSLVNLHRQKLRSEKNALPRVKLTHFKKTKLKLPFQAERLSELRARRIKL